MINPAQISQLVRTTLKEFNIYETSIEKLIKGTFLLESNLEDLYFKGDGVNDTYGLMQMSNTRLTYLIKEYISFRYSSKSRLLSVSANDSSDIEKVKDECNFNIKLMIVILYEFYSSKYSTIPEMDTESVMAYYLEYYDDAASYTLAEAVEIYEDVFVG